MGLRANDYLGDGAMHQSHELISVNLWAKEELEREINTTSKRKTKKERKKP